MSQRPLCRNPAHYFCLHCTVPNLVTWPQVSAKEAGNVAFRWIWGSIRTPWIQWGLCYWGKGENCYQIARSSLCHKLLRCSRRNLRHLENILESGKSLHFNINVLFKSVFWLFGTKSLIINIRVFEHMEWEVVCGVLLYHLSASPWL